MNVVRSAKVNTRMLTFSLGGWLALSGAAAAAPDYGAYAAVLETYVDEAGWVDYARLKEHAGSLEKALEVFATTSPDAYASWDEPAQTAFWLNAYNAYTLKAIVEHYPIQSRLLRSVIYPDNSIRQIPGVWKSLEWEVLGDRKTLDAIEHEILRQDFDEPRIHAALVCAAISCPPLRTEPFTGAELDAQLADQMRHWLRQPGKFAIDREAGRVYLSKIFQWFAADFESQYGDVAPFSDRGDKEGAVLHAVSLYLPEEQAEYLRTGEYRVRYLDYDWTLNDQALERE